MTPSLRTLARLESSRMPVSSICAIACRGAAPAASTPEATPSIAAPLRKSRLPSFVGSLMASSSSDLRFECPGPLAARAARGNGPQRFDAFAPPGDVPIVQVHRRIAVAGDQLHLLAQ